MIRTGSIGLDIALHGGWTPGIHEIWGDTGSGKTVLALHAAEEATRARTDTLWVDTVGGVAHMDNAPTVVVLPEREAERAFSVMEMACDERSIGLIVVDSANYLVRRAELNGDPSFVPHPQREYKDELTSLKRVAVATGTVVLFVSQPRDKERQPVRGTGISEKVKYRVHLHPDVIHQNGDREIQATVKDVPGKITKHDVARFTIKPGFGIARALELVHVADRMGLIGHRGTWYHCDGWSAQGASGFAAIVDDTNLRYTLDKRVREATGIG